MNFKPDCCTLQKLLTNGIYKILQYQRGYAQTDEQLERLWSYLEVSFNNLLAEIYYSKSELGIIIVTHCRSITIINQILEINPKKELIEEKFDYKCNSCFGVVDDKGILCLNNLSNIIPNCIIIIKI